MASFRNLLRTAPRELQKEYIARHAVELEDKIDWTGPDSAVLQSIAKAIRDSSPHVRNLIQTDAERILALGEDAGEAAIRSVVTGPAALEQLPGSAARALYLFV